MLFSLSNRRKALRYEQSKIDNQFIRFMNELQHSLQNDEDLTVILADTFSAPVEHSKVEFSIAEKQENTATPEERNDYPQKPSVQRAITPPFDSSRAGRFSCFAGGVFGDDSFSRDQATDLLRTTWENPEFSFLRGSQDSDPDVSRLFPASTHPSPSAMRAGAQAWREQRGRTAANDSSINFRTGMSGHMALLSTQTHAHEYLEPTWMTRPTSSSRMMSSHTGLTLPKLPTLQAILNSLTLPVTSSTPPQRENSGQIQHSGSM